MLKKQAPYDFKKELLEVHKKDVRDMKRQPLDNEFVFTDGIRIVLPEQEDVVITTAAKDFVDYLFVSMKVPAMITDNCPNGLPAVYLSVSSDVAEEAKGYMGYQITVKKDSISIVGYDNVGVAQGLFFLEDLMNLRKAPFLEIGKFARHSMFDVRSTHSPFGMFEYPDEAFALMAHRGYNTISLWLTDECTTLRGDFIDVNLICERAARWGINVGAEFYVVHSMHPDDPGAQEFYDNMYSNLFRDCPKLTGISLVGEANQFQSRDPRVGKTPNSKNFVENIPTGKLAPGWWPCNDLHKLVRMVDKSIKKANPKAKVSVCSYNWGHAPEEDRLKLIDSLPDGINFAATWDMFQKYQNGDAVFHVSDYSLKVSEPGQYFISEAKAIQKRDIHMSAITNSAGKTWDFGVIPYEPMPGQWIKRYDAIRKAHYEWGLSGLVENIHYGFQPSIIGDLEKWAFFAPAQPLDNVLEALLIRDFEDNAKAAGEAMECFSEAITHYPTSDDEQYGAFRIGPSYPFWVQMPPNDGKKPDKRHAMWGNGIYNAEYMPDSCGRNSMPGVRLMVSLEELKTMKALFEKGIGILEDCPNPNDKLLRLTNMCKFMLNTIITGINIKHLFILKHKLQMATTADENEQILNDIEALLISERKNAENTIPLVQVDSLLGWEPSMEYTTDEEGLRWKLRQVDHELEHVIPMYRKSNKLIEMFKS